MAELDLERQPAVSHSELTSGHDVTQLLSQINQNFKQSKADQILRLLQDQDKLTDPCSESVVDDTELIREYEQIREEKVICDSDTLTDSSSDSGETVNTVQNHNTENLLQNSQHQDNINMQGSNSIVQESRDIRSFRRHRARTSVGFHDMNGEIADNETSTINNNFDTRDLSVRPKSSYVRRHQYKKRDDDPGGGLVNGDFDDVPLQRPSKSARPKSRLGRASVPRSERKITMVEIDIVTPEPESVAPSKEDLTIGGANNPMYDRFASSRQPKRESKRAKAFCDVDNVSQQQTIENMNVDTSVSVMDTRDDVTEVQTISPNTNVRSSHVSSFTNSSVPRNVPVQKHVSHVQKRPSNAHSRHEPSQTSHHYQAPGVPVESHLTRSDTTTSNATLRSERPENISPTSQIPLKRNNSNLTYGRPKNPEPVTTRPIERPDIRPSTRTRRLHRRFMAPTQQAHMSQVRPTSESVILARQKTEKNLMKKQAENRPHSEKIILNSPNKNIDLSLNPTQGPQTYVTSKGGVAQSSHVQEGFRGYDPGNRLKSSVQARDLPGDLTLPRRGQNNVMMGGRQQLAALMKLPPLEASLAAKKKERGLTLAARETCV